jgi:Leucine-rich repeat (LRR) protein
MTKSIHKVLALFLAMILMLAAIPAVVLPTSAAALGASIQFGDDTFKAALISDVGVDTNKDNEISVAEAAAYDGAIILAGWGFTSLDGIEYFTSLTQLCVDNNALSGVLDLSNNTALEFLDCSGNQLTGLDITGLSRLTTLICYNNDIELITDIIGLNEEQLGQFDHDEFGPFRTFEEALRISQGWDDGREITQTMKNELTELDITEMGVTSLDGVEEYTNLTELNCARNKLTEMDISKNVKLVQLDCESNPFGYNGKLDVSKNTKLESLNCSGMGLLELDVSKNTKLQWLFCSWNQLSTLDVSKNIDLVGLFVDQNNLTTLDITGLNLSELNVDGNCMASEASIIGLDKDSLSYFEFGEQRAADTSAVIKFADPKFEAALLEMYNYYGIAGDGKITQAEAAAETGSIFVEDKGITSLAGIEYFTALTGLYCYKNELTTLDVSKNTKLEILLCSENQLTSLDVTHNPELRNLQFAHNFDFDANNAGLGTVDLSKNTKLEIVYGGAAGIEKIDVSHNPRLKELHIDWNLQKSLDVSKNTELVILNCTGNAITSLNLTNNKALTRVYCDMNSITGMNITGLQNLVELRCENNLMTSEAAIIGLNKAQLVDGYTFSPQKVDDLQQALEDPTSTPEDILTALDTPTGAGSVYDDLLNAALEDETAAEYIAEVEEAYAEKANVTVDPPKVEEDAPDFLQGSESQIKVTGAAFNAEKDTTVNLKVSQPTPEAAAAATAAVDDTLYDTDNMVQVEIDLEGVADSSNLTYPVAITIPIPPSIDPDELVILHVSSDGTVEVIKPVINSDGTCTFVVTHFSTFAFTKAVTPVVEPGDTGDPTGPSGPLAPAYPGSGGGSTGGSGSGSSGGGGGGGSVNPFSALDATKAAKETASVIAKAVASGSESATVRFVNIKDISLATMKDMAAQAKKAGVTLKVNVDTVVNNKIVMRQSFNPADATKSVQFGASTTSGRAVAAKTLFGKYYSNKLEIFALHQKEDFGMNVHTAIFTSLTAENAAVYTYNASINQFKQLLDSKMWKDSKGYLQFDTSLAYNFILSEGKLAKK